MFKSWEKIKIINKNGEEVEASAPIIISASRSTDIPAFYSKWLMDKIEKGYMVWRNPFNNAKSYISFLNTRVIVFWSKNPKPLIKYLPELDKQNINYYFQFTLNDYEKENFEPKVPPLEKRIETFKTLSEKIGKEKVIWRFDPLIITSGLNENLLIDKIKRVGDKIHKYTKKLVFSFADINIYRKVRNNLNKQNIEYFEFDTETMKSVAKKIEELNKNWGLELATCCESINLDEYSIKHNKCIDDDLIIKLFKHDEKLMEFLGYDGTEQTDLFNENKKRPNLKDKGQRKVCGCIVSKDIGEYDTCEHLCVYCYANTSEKNVKAKRKMHRIENEGITQ